MQRKQSHHCIALITSLVHTPLSPTAWSSCREHEKDLPPQISFTCIRLCSCLRQIIRNSTAPLKKIRDNPTIPDLKTTLFPTLKSCLGSPTHTTNVNIMLSKIQSQPYSTFRTFCFGAQLRTASADPSQCCYLRTVLPSPCYYQSRLSKNIPNVATTMNISAQLMTGFGKKW